MEEFILCHKNNGNTWVCKRGFETFQKANDEAQQMTFHHTNFQTKIIPSMMYTPDFIQEKIIQYKLTPRVLLREQNYMYHSIYNI